MPIDSYVCTLLVGGFARGNVPGFHAADGSGYRFITDVMVGSHRPRWGGHRVPGTHEGCWGMEYPVHTRDLTQESRVISCAG
jgi:hypothetical protein